MSVISRKFSTKITTLKSEFENNKDIVHQGVKGGLNENELSELIKDVIPQKYQLTKGIIESAVGGQSNETDILIYDDEILPLYMKNDLTFVPVEAVKYNFEVKSTLNSTELKTTLLKFERFKEIGGISPTVLFSFSTDMKGSELKRLKNYDKNFHINPAISVLCTSNKSYYYKSISDHYIKDYISKSEYIKLFMKDSDLDIDAPYEVMRELMADNIALSDLNRSQFASVIQAWINLNKNLNNRDDKNLTVNGIDYDEITFKIHKWIGVEVENNDIEMSFLSGISNTLSKGNFGQYLLNESTAKPKIFAVYFEDMWGNFSGQGFDEKGLNFDTEKLSFKFQTSEESSKILFDSTSHENN